MSKPKFTPGPWKVRQYNHYIGKNYTTRRTHKVENKSGLQVVCTVTSGVYAQGNLDLIAAAPEMYDFINYFLTVSGQSVLRFLPYDIAKKIFDEADRITRKARGESEVKNGK